MLIATTVSEKQNKQAVCQAARELFGDFDGQKESCGDNLRVHRHN